MQKKDRITNAKMNIVISVICQFITIACGFVLPKILITEFGSEIYGATTSITQFLAYIALIEGGIGGVARATLYGPLAENNQLAINRILTEVKRFFFIIGCFFILYVVIISVYFDDISDIGSLDSKMTAMLVVVISLSTCMEYFVGISNQLFLQAAQKNYVISLLTAITVLLNMIISLFLVSIGANIVVVKFFSGCVFIIKPIFLCWYVRVKYQVKKTTSEEKYLKDKWTGMGQHIAYFLHSNTDVVVLTIFTNLKLVAVYSIYNMIVSQMQKIVLSFTSGMEAFFGDLLAKNEQRQLNDIFKCYELLTSIVSTIVYAVTATLIVPFVLLYLKNVTDINYTRHGFAFFITIAAFIYCLRQPYHKIIIAAGHFKQTRIAAYGEVVINVLASLLLVMKFDLIGVALGTIMAVLYRTGYYILYVNKNILHRAISESIKRYVVNITVFTLCYICATKVLSHFVVSDFFEWVVNGTIIFSTISCIVIIINYFFFKKEFKTFFNVFVRQGKNNKLYIVKIRRASKVNKG